jgi:hypothetical protein
LTRISQIEQIRADFVAYRPRSTRRRDGSFFWVFDPLTPRQESRKTSRAPASRRPSSPSHSIRLIRSIREIRVNQPPNQPSIRKIA